MKSLMLAALILLATESTSSAAIGDRIADRPSAGTVRIFELDQDFGTVRPAATGSPRAASAQALAQARWGAGAEAFARQFAAGRGGNGTESFTVRSVYEDQLGQVHVRLDEVIGGLAVAGSDLILHIDKQTGRVFGVNGRFAIDRGLSREPRTGAADALATAMADYGIVSASLHGLPELTYVVDEQGGVRLAWTILVSYVSAQGLETDQIYADARTGGGVGRSAQVRRAKNREIYNCNHGTKWTDCSFGWAESCGFCWSRDPAMANAWVNAGTAYDYFLIRHNRDGQNDAGVVFRQGVHFEDVNYANAGGPPAPYQNVAVVYGDGQGSYSSPLADSLDIVAHEFTHGVVRYTANIPYADGKEGAMIEEGLADVFAVMTTSYSKGISPDWQIAEDVFTKDTANDAMRYLNDPARQKSPKQHYDYYPLRKAGADPHLGAGLTGLAFYLFAKGGYHPRRATIPVNPVGEQLAAQIFYRALTVYMTSDTNFRRLRDYTRQAALDLDGDYGRTSMENAWTAVGNDWQTQSFTLASGSTWISPEYASPLTSTHTGHVIGPAGVSYNAVFERSSGTGWTILENATTTGETVLESYASASSTTSPKFRWRVKANGPGAFTVHWNYAK
jgi:vibriolysin